MVLALLEHTRAHAAFLEADAAELSVTVAASARCLALCTNLTPQAVSKTLSDLCAMSAEGPDPVLARASRGRPCDAYTYALDLRGFLRSRGRRDGTTEPPLSQVFPLRSMTTAVPLDAQARLLEVASHDAFVLNGSATEIGAAYGASQGWLLGLLASHLEGLDVPTLAAASGLGEPAVRKALRTFRPNAAAGAHDLHSVLQPRGRGEPYRLRFRTDTEVDRWLDDVAEARGTAGTLARRAEHVAEDRERYRQGWADRGIRVLHRDATGTAPTTSRR